MNSLEVFHVCYISHVLNDDGLLQTGKRRKLICFLRFSITVI